MKRPVGLVAALVAALLAVPAAASAATIPVTTTADQLALSDDGACSLREAVQAASQDAAAGGCPAGDGGVEDVIELPSGTYELTRSGQGEDANSTGDLDPDVTAGEIEIAGPGGALPVIDGVYEDRAIDVHGNGSFRLTAVRITGSDPQNDLAPADSESGGAIRWSEPGEPGDLTITGSRLDSNFAKLAGAVDAETTGEHLIADTYVEGNYSGDHGAVRSAGELTILRSQVSSNGGGGVYAENPGAGSLSVESSTIAENQIGADLSAGGVYAAGPASIVNSTVTGNTGGFVGGVEPHGPLLVRFSTIAENGTGNAAGNAAGGVDLLDGGSATIEGSILAGNVPNDCNAATASEGAFPNLESDEDCGFDAPGSLMGADARLAPLTANGGPTKTRGLYPDSPAVDAAGDCAPLAADQRGAGRPEGPACDIGSFEGTVPRAPVAVPSTPARKCRKGRKLKKGRCVKPKRRGKKRRKKGRARSLAAPPRTIGRSVDGRPIRAFRFGEVDAERSVLVVGSIHGDERAGIRITRRLRRIARPADGLQLWVIDTVNPDGVRAHTRRNARGVDLNRNYPHRWRGGVPRSSGYYPGPRAASEPETRAVMRLVKDVEPDLSIWYHQPWGAVLACRGKPPAGGRYAKLTGMSTSCRGDNLPGTAIGWEAEEVSGSESFVVELAAGTIRKRTALRHARAALALAREG